MTTLGLLKRLAIVTAVFFGALTYVAYVRLGFAGQLPDLNPLGASESQIRNGTYRPLDFGFLVCLTVLLALVARILRPRRFWWAVLGLALIFCAADLAENYLLAQFINDGAQPDDSQRAGWINLSTRIKFAALLLAAAAAITSWRQPASGR